jgi:SAM-dependent methyltransferase
MDRYDNATYGDRLAEVYDEFTQISPKQTQTAVETLATLASGGRVLELGIGTGRVAVPLAGLGLSVHGIDASTKMLDELRRKPGGESITVTVGDFSEVAVDGRFHLVYVVFNTFFVLLSQEAQLRCFANVAAHLEPGGVFAIEAFVPDLSRYLRNQNVSVGKIGIDEVRLDVTVHDPLHQRVECQHVVVANGSTRIYPIQIRYAWPSELDLMARLAGLRLKERWGNWQRSPFSSSDTTHISLYEPAENPSRANIR